MLEEQTGTLKNMQDSLYSPCIQYMYGTSQQPVEPEENTIGTAQLWDRLLAWGARALESPFQTFLMVGSGTEDASVLLYNKRIYFRLFSTSHLSNHFTGFWGSFSDIFEAIICVLAVSNTTAEPGAWKFQSAFIGRFCDSVRHVLYVYVGAKQGAF